MNDKINKIHTMNLVSCFTLREEWKAAVVFESFLHRCCGGGGSVGSMFMRLDFYRFIYCPLLRMLIATGAHIPEPRSKRLAIFEEYTRHKYSR